jgi:dUTP pyrophosphatase
VAEELVVRVVRLDPELPLPAYACAGDAGMDVLARSPATLAAGGGRAMVPTGIAVELPEGWAGFVLPRSGLAAKHGITCLNTPGLIDSGYRDEIRVILVNHDPTSEYRVERGDRIAQLVVQRVACVRWEEAGALSDSSRGTGGFGHSGR